MVLETYKITEEDLKEYLIDLRNEVYNDTNITGIIKRAYEDVKTRIYELNHDVQEAAHQQPQDARQDGIRPRREQHQTT